MPNRCVDEPAGVLKIGQVGIATLRVQQMDMSRLINETRQRVRNAPALFQRMGLIVDFSALPHVPSMTTTKNLFKGLRRAGVLPIGLTQRSPEIERLADKLGIPVLNSSRRPAEPEQPESKAEPAISAVPGQVQFGAVRSGQQVYAPGCDLSIVGTVGAAAEVIADGSIHVYGALRGRALAGAHGHATARIFCSRFHAELVAIAGCHQTLDDIPVHLRGQPVQVWLEGEQIMMSVLD